VTASPAVASAGSSVSASAADTEGTALTVKDFALDPDVVEAAGAVTLAVTNAGPTVHNVAVRDAVGKLLATTADLKPGASETLTVDLPPGGYVLFCSLPGHESLGIKGTLTVRP
jgi:uncharacterized cupredoxin-like copper-binding protein